MKLNEAVKILGLQVPFDADAAKTAYRMLAMKNHPDKGGSVEAMAELNAAYKVCSQGVGWSVPEIDVTGCVFQPIKRRSKAKLKSVVKWFGEQMIGKLKDRGWKGFTWRDESGELLYGKLIKECVELRTEISRKKKSKRAIINECADVANFAMFIADNARRKL